MGVRKQSGCVVFRYNRKFELDILLVKSSDGEDWVFPKGGVEKHLTAKQSAAKEVYEEAGVAGTIMQTLGVYEYKKRGKPQRVVMYAMHYKNDTADWPEKHLRKRKWFSMKDARKKVPKKLKPFLDELAKGDFLSLSMTSHVEQAAHHIRMMPVIEHTGAEVRVSEGDDIVHVELPVKDGVLRMEISEWNMHPMSEALTIQYTYTGEMDPHQHFKRTTLGQLVGHVGRIIGRYMGGV